MVERDDVIHLAELARLQLSEAEVDGLRTELSAIVDYVSQVQSLTVDDVSIKTLGAVANVTREDVVTNQPGQYSEDLLRAAPQTQDGYVVVQKILDADAAPDA